MEVLIIVIAVVLAFNAGYAFRAIHARYKLEQLREEIADNMEEAERMLRENYINIRVEKHNDELFMYNIVDESFICQGKTRKELDQKFTQMYPNKKGIIHDGINYWKEAHE